MFLSRVFYTSLINNFFFFLIFSTYYLTYNWVNDNWVHGLFWNNILLLWCKQKKKKKLFGQLTIRFVIDYKIFRVSLTASRHINLEKIARSLSPSLGDKNHLVPKGTPLIHDGMILYCLRHGYREIISQKQVRNPYRTHICCYGIRLGW